jgi:hypothetical protein
LVALKSAFNGVDLALPAQEGDLTLAFGAGDLALGVPMILLRTRLFTASGLLLTVLEGCESDWRAKAPVFKGESLFEASSFAASSLDLDGESVLEELALIDLAGESVLAGMDLAGESVLAGIDLAGDAGLLMLLDRVASFDGESVVLALSRCCLAVSDFAIDILMGEAILLVSVFVASCLSAESLFVTDTLMGDPSLVGGVSDRIMAPALDGELTLAASHFAWRDSLMGDAIFVAVMSGLEASCLVPALDGESVLAASSICLFRAVLSGEEDAFDDTSTFIVDIIILLGESVLFAVECIFPCKLGELTLAAGSSLDRSSFAMMIFLHGESDVVESSGLPALAVGETCCACASLMGEGDWARCAVLGVALLLGVPKTVLFTGVLLASCLAARSHFVMDILMGDDRGLDVALVSFVRMDRREAGELAVSLAVAASFFNSASFFVGDLLFWSGSATMLPAPHAFSTPVDFWPQSGVWVSSTWKVSVSMMDCRAKLSGVPGHCSLSSSMSIMEARASVFL